MKDNQSVQASQKWMKVGAVGLLIAVAAGGAWMLDKNEASKSVATKGESTSGLHSSHGANAASKVEVIPTKQKDLSSVSEQGFAGRYQLTSGPSEKCGAPRSIMIVKYRLDSNPAIEYGIDMMHFTSFNLGPEIQEPYPGDPDPTGYSRETKMDSSDVRTAHQIAYSETTLQRNQAAAQLDIRFSINQDTLMYAARKKILIPELTAEPAFEYVCVWARQK